MQGALLVAFGAAAQNSVPTTDVSVGGTPFSRMHTILEKTIFKVDVMSLDVCLDQGTAGSLARFAAGRRSSELDDSIAQAVIRAPVAISRIRFLRDIGFNQFLDGIGEEQRKAVAAGLLADSVQRMIADSLPHWFTFLKQRNIRDEDQIFYEFEGDTMRTRYIAADGSVLLDRTDLGRDRRTSVLATYFAPGSGFRKGLLRSLDSANGPPPDNNACTLPARAGAAIRLPDAFRKTPGAGRAVGRGM